MAIANFAAKDFTAISEKCLNSLADTERHTTPTTTD